MALSIISYSVSSIGYVSKCILKIWCFLITLLNHSIDGIYVGCEIYVFPVVPCENWDHSAERSVGLTTEPSGCLCNSSSHRMMVEMFTLQTTREGEKIVPVFVLVIHLSGSSFSSHNLQSSSSGWVVTRKLQDFHTVHERLVQVDSLQVSIFVFVSCLKLYVQN